MTPSTKTRPPLDLSVGNLKTTKNGIRCDRHSVLGNPFHMWKKADRDAVIEGFRRYLWRVLHIWDEPQEAAEAIARELNLDISNRWNAPTRDELIEALDAIEQQGTATLLCWCFPKPCHCDIIIKYLVWWQASR